MAAYFYGTVTCNGNGAGNATVTFDGPPNASVSANSEGQYMIQLEAGAYEIKASGSPCSDQTKSRTNYDNGFHNVNFDL